MRRSIYIDRVTGTWGDANDLIMVDPDMEGQHMDPEGDEMTCISALESLDNDSDIIQIAEDAYREGHGHRYKALVMHYEQLGGSA